MADNPPIKIYINKTETENRLTFKIITGYSLELLTHETMKLHWNTERNISKDKNGEHKTHFDITKVALVHSNL